MVALYAHLINAPISVHGLNGLRTVNAQLHAMVYSLVIKREQDLIVKKIPPTLTVDLAVQQRKHTKRAVRHAHA
jgi:hypothetical protein